MGDRSRLTDAQAYALANQIMHRLGCFPGRKCGRTEFGHNVARLVDLLGSQEFAQSTATGQIEAVQGTFSRLPGRPASELERSITKIVTSAIDEAMDGDWQGGVTGATQDLLALISPSDFTPKIYPKTP